MRRGRIAGARPPSPPHLSNHRPVDDQVPERRDRGHVGAPDDALGGDVLIADRLDGGPLPIEHGGPWRLVSASQYGYKSVKHLCRIELHSREPSDRHTRSISGLALTALGEHPRARVWQEESHRYVPARSVRWAYGSLAHPSCTRSATSEHCAQDAGDSRHASVTIGSQFGSCVVVTGPGSIVGSRPGRLRAPRGARYPPEGRPPPRPPPARRRRRARSARRS